MKVLFNVCTPGQVHVFRNLVGRLRASDEVYVASRDSPMINRLLAAYGLDSFLVPYHPGGPLWVVREALDRLSAFFSLSSGCDLDVVVGGLDPFAFFASAVASGGTRRLCVADNRPNVNPFVPLQFAVLPFVDSVITFDSVRRYEGYDYGPKKVEVPSYKELAYLHPDLFRPDRLTLSRYGLCAEEYVVLRFSGWGAYHDVGRRGFSLRDKMLLVRTLEQYVDVYVSSEKPLPSGLEKYELLIEPEDIHDVLYFSRFLVSDSQTMTTEAGVMGVPAVRCNSFVGERDMGNFMELERKYRLIYNFSRTKDVIDTSLALLNKSYVKKIWDMKKRRMLEDKINFTDFLDAYLNDIQRNLHERI